MPATAALIKRLGDIDSSVRLAAIQGLGVLSPRVLEDPPRELVRAVENELGTNRDAAARALVSYRKGLPRLIPSLVQSTETSSPPLRAVYLKILLEIQPPAFSNDAVPGFTGALASKDAEIRALAAARLVQFKAADRATISALLAALSEATKHKATTPATTGPQAPDFVIPIIDAIGRLGHDAPPSEGAPAALAVILHDGDTKQQVAAAQAMSRLQPSPTLFATLIGKAGAEDTAVQLAILQAIHNVDFREPYTVPKLLGDLLEHESAAVRDAAAGAICHAGTGVDPYVPALLRHAEHDPDMGVRSTCGTVVGILQPPRITAAVVPVMIPALASTDGGLRIHSARLLATLGRAAAPAVPALIQATRAPALKKSWGDDRIEAALALGRIAPGTSQADPAAKALLDLLHSAPKLAPGLITPLAAFGPKSADAIPRLRELAKHEMPHIREAASKALTQIDAPR